MLLGRGSPPSLRSLCVASQVESFFPVVLSLTAWECGWWTQGGWATGVADLSDLVPFSRRTCDHDPVDVIGSSGGVRRRTFES